MIWGFPMNLMIFSVFDRAAQAYGRPIFVQSTGIAIRSFTDEVNRVASDNDMNKHPDDFDLYLLGVFDDVTGEMVVEKVPQLLARAKDVVISS